VVSSHPIFAASPDALQLRPAIQAPSKEQLTLVGAVRLAQEYFPRLEQQRAEVRAAKRSVTLQKVLEYNPDSMLSYQDVAASHNRLTQTLFSTSVLPSTPGPGPESVRMNADAFSAAGFIIDWAPIDFGLHKARIDRSKAEYSLADAAYKATALDVTVQAASAFLDALVMKEQVAVAEANVDRFAEFSNVVHAQVNAGLQSGADASLADAQLANAKNNLIRANLNDELARAALGYAVGKGGEKVSIEPGGIINVTEPVDPQKTVPNFELHPLALQGKAIITTRLASKKVLDKEYYPKFRWLGGVNLRGTTFNTNRGDVPAPDVSGFFPTVPNWNVGLMIDLPLFDIIRIKAEKRVVLERITAAQHGYNLVLQGLKRDDVQAESTVRAAIALAANMPVQVQAATLAAQQAQARYQAGLGTVAQVAEANQLLADSRVKAAVANVGVWRALLSVANVHGDLQPFLKAADAATAREVR
jgi:outer membrane protein TolC